MERLESLQNQIREINFSDLTSLKINALIKVFLLALLVVYFLYALAIRKQVGIMNGVLETDQAGNLKKLANIHWLVNIILFLLVLIFI